jgi:hypothetical protein
MARASNWNCLDCGKSTRISKEYYMIHDHLWSTVAKNPKGMMCISCVEKKLGRKLVPNDFTDCRLNKIDFLPFWFGGKDE